MLKINYALPLQQQGEPTILSVKKRTRKTFLNKNQCTTMRLKIAPLNFASLTTNCLSEDKALYNHPPKENDHKYHQINILLRIDSII